MGLPWKKFGDGWGYDENPKTTRKRIKNHTQNSIDEELSGFRPNKRFGKRKKKVEKPFKIWYRYVGGGWIAMWHGNGEWTIYKEFAKESDRDHEFEKMKRGWMGSKEWYEMAKEKPEE